MAGFILRGLIAALGLWAASEMFDAVDISSNNATMPSLRPVLGPTGLKLPTSIDSSSLRFLLLVS